MNTWGKKIESCIEDKNKRYLLKNIPLDLLSAELYVPPLRYWFAYVKVNLN